ncbi:MAG: division/cell wall cluster transcriptional repressor MraZ [Nitrospinaceae bacterium]|nr:MAG: division/cell wall cluster transcriptional repressor MraZ [Nitrospinaceae bacterium]
MPGFLGTYSITVDEKGRVTVPSKLRGVLEKNYGPELVICQKGDYLLIFPEKEWAVNEENLSKLNAFDEDDRKKLRAYYSQAADCEIKSGKILIPANLREAAGLNKEAILVGMSRTFEIWDADRWADQTG